MIPISSPMKPLRRNVCAVLTDAERRQVLVFRRVNEDWLANPWQFPQGGLKRGEAPLDALRRELEEEIGTGDAEVLAAAPRPIRYEYPPDVLENLARRHSKMARFRGQEQYWFLARLRQGTDAIHFNHEPREFDAFRWVTPEEAQRIVVPFKQQAYREGLAALNLLREPTSA
jgi:putative (di)nucleoside polyphosphate hydrolase